MARKKSKTRARPRFPTIDLRALLSAHRFVIVRALAVLAWIGVLGGLAAAWVVYVPQLQGYVSNKHVSTSPVFVRFIDPPKWVHGELESQLVYTVRVNISSDPLDRSGLVAARQSLLHTGWFEHVHQVRRETSALVTIEAEFAQPYAVVRDRDADHLIDDHGRLLPPTFGVGEAQGSFIAVVGTRFPRPAQAGQAWEGTDISSALRLMRMLHDQPWWSQVAAIDVATYMHDQSLTIVTDRGGRIAWGRIPGEEAATEVPATRKLEYVNHHFTRHGHIDRGFSSLDIRTDTVTTGDTLAP